MSRHATIRLGEMWLEIFEGSISKKKEYHLVAESRNRFPISEELGKQLEGYFNEKITKGIARK